MDLSGAVGSLLPCVWRAGPQKADEGAASGGRRATPASAPLDVPGQQQGGTSVLPSKPPRVSGPLDDPVPHQLPPASPALHSAVQVTPWAPGPPLETNSNNNNKNISQGIRKTGVKFSPQQTNLTAVQLL